jgi:hypothetical protein
LEHCST